MAKPVRGVTISGGDGPNDILGTAGNDSLSGLGGDDYLYGLGGNDSLYGGTGHDVLDAGAGDDTLYGNEGDDLLVGREGNDYLAGQEGNDALYGGEGNDFLGAGPGNDTLVGGTGADRFFFAVPFEPVMNVHTITDFDQAERDYIDLKSIDADGDPANNTRKGNTDFTVVDTPTGAAGEAWLVAIIDPLSGNQTGLSIYLNCDSDADADMRIDVRGVTSLNWGTDIIG